MVSCAVRAVLRAACRVGVGVVLRDWMCEMKERRPLWIGRQVSMGQGGGLGDVH